MVEIKKTYYLQEITIKVNKRELLYDFRDEKVVYTYKNINKQVFELKYEKWRKLLDKHKYWSEYSFDRYEEISNDFQRKTI